LSPGDGSYRCHFRSESLPKHLPSEFALQCGRISNISTLCPLKRNARSIRIVRWFPPFNKLGDQFLASLNLKFGEGCTSR
jgi:hypothetical protein